MDARLPPQGARALPGAPDADLGLADARRVDFDDIHYFVRASERAERSWDDVPEDVKNTFDRLGIPEAEKKYLALALSTKAKSSITLCAKTSRSRA